MRPIVFNGKFLSAPMTGVHRVAEEVIRAADDVLAVKERKGILACPKDAQRLLPLHNIPHWRVGRLTWQWWEQAELPRMSALGPLVNLCNLGPIAVRDAVTMIHDAQVIESPASYSPAFRFYYRAIQPIIARRHRAMLTVSRYSAEALARHGVAPSGVIRVAMNGADHVARTTPDLSAYRRFGLRPGRYVLALASAQAHKNIAVLCRAFRDPRLADLTLVLFGGGDIRDIDPDPPSNVVPIGRVSDSELFGLMRSAAAYACPSLTEGFGLPALEAMASDCPVVAAPCGALPEVCDDAALYAAPDHSGDWVEALLRIADEPSLASEMRDKGRARSSQFRWADAAATLVQVVDEMEDARDAELAHGGRDRHPRPA
ncbi:MAG: glycosyltransferase family 1 protein [Pseudomonadota bacterium]